VLPYTISLVLNHVSVTKGSVTSKHYIMHTFDREKRDALDRLAAALRLILADKTDEKVRQFPKMVKA
jgi:hypothetical protein